MKLQYPNAVDENGDENGERSEILSPRNPLSSPVSFTDATSPVGGWMWLGAIR